MDLNKIKSPLGIFFLFAGSTLLITACTQAYPIIPITAVKEITPADPIVRLIMGIAGVVLLVAGFSLVKVLIQLIGFFGGGVLGMYIFQLMLPGSGATSIIGFAVGGLIGMAIALTATSVGVFITGMGVGAALSQQIWLFLEGTPAPWYGIALVSILGGILTLWLFSYWVAGLTSLIGAILLGMALNLMPVYWVVLFVAGVVIQTLISRQRPMVRG